jgi:hypothetical protein
VEAAKVLEQAANNAGVALNKPGFEHDIHESNDKKGHDTEKKENHSA